MEVTRGVFACGGSASLIDIQFWRFASRSTAERSSIFRRQVDRTKSADICAAVRMLAAAIGSEVAPDTTIPESATSSIRRIGTLTIAKRRISSSFQHCLVILVACSADFVQPAVSNISTQNYGYIAEHHGFGMSEVETANAVLDDFFIFKIKNSSSGNPPPVV